MCRLDRSGAVDQRWLVSVSALVESEYGDPLATGRDRYLAFFASAWRDLELGKAKFNVTARQPWSRKVGPLLLRLEGESEVEFETSGEVAVHRLLNLKLNGVPLDLEAARSGLLGLVGAKGDRYKALASATQDALASILTAPVKEEETQRFFDDAAVNAAVVDAGAFGEPGFEAYLGLREARSGLAAHLEALLEEQEMAVYADDVEFLALGEQETVVLLTGQAALAQALASLRGARAALRESGAVTWDKYTCNVTTGDDLVVRADLGYEAASSWASAALAAALATPTIGTLLSLKASFNLTMGRDLPHRVTSVRPVALSLNGQKIQPPALAKWASAALGPSGLLRGAAQQPEMVTASDAEATMRFAQTCHSLLADAACADDDEAARRFVGVFGEGVELRGW